MSGFEKKGHLAQISIERYDPKLATNHNLVYFLITVLAQTTILYLPLVQERCPCILLFLHASTFIHSIRYSLREWEAWSRDLNVTVATNVAQQASKTDFLARAHSQMKLKTAVYTATFCYEACRIVVNAQETL